MLEQLARGWVNGNAVEPADVGRFALEAPGFGLLVGLKARGLQVIAVPFAGVAMACGLEVSAGFETTDAGFDGAIVAREVRRRK